MKASFPFPSSLAIIIMIFCLILIIIGVVFLLQNLGYISGGTWSIIWPAILIIFGLWILLRKREEGFFLAPLENFWEKRKSEKE